MKNTLPYTLIDTAGQTTAVIDVPVPRSKQPTIAQPFMKSVKNIGQVCFIEKENGTYRLQMMGNELSVNGSLAGAFYLSNKLKSDKYEINLSGLQKTAFYFNKNIKFPNLIIHKTKDVVELDGIIYKLIPGFVAPKVTASQKRILQKLAIKYPASGIVYFERNQIQPLLFVKATNTYVWETCCGSASIAYTAISNQKVIVQPSGEKVVIKVRGKDIIYSARCAVLK